VLSLFATEIDTLSLHDALPISGTNEVIYKAIAEVGIDWRALYAKVYLASTESIKNFLLKTDCFSFLSIHAISKELQNGELQVIRSEEHTSELQSRENLVCRLLL